MLGYPLIDTDHVIEKDTGKSISSIFADEGEATFRELESKLLLRLIDSKTSHHIISTGGGIVNQKENITLLRQLGFVVWLACSVDAIHQRTSRNNNRPLLQCDNPKQVITEMLEQRSPHYQASSHLKIDNSNLAINEITCGILESARYHFGSVES